MLFSKSYLMIIKGCSKNTNDLTKDSCVVHQYECTSKIQYLRI